MRILKIIPAAFDYFDDIRAAAFALTEGLNQVGVEVEALTIQYETPSRRTKETITVAAPSRHYRGTVPLAQVEQNLAQFDVLHVHAPLFGAAGKVLQWKRAFPRLPLVVTVHRRVRTPDFFSLAVMGYNLWYLPKLLTAASLIATPALNQFRAMFFRSFRRWSAKAVEVNDSPEWFGAAKTPFRTVSGSWEGRIAEITAREENLDSIPAELRLACKYRVVYNEVIRASTSTS